MKHARLPALFYLSFLAASAMAEELDWKAGRLGHLAASIGTYRHQEVLADPTVAAAIQRLLPEEALPLIAQNLQVTAPLDFISGYLVISGNRAHHGGEDEAQVWIKIYDGSAIVLLTTGGQRSLYAEEERYSFLPVRLRESLASAPSDMLVKAPDDLRWHDRETASR